MRDLTQSSLDTEFRRHPDQAVTYEGRIRNAKQQVRNTNWRQFLLARFPIIGVVYRYKFREYILSDLLSGVSVGMSSVPQAMGYAAMLHIPLQYGLYTLIFSSLIYSVLTTSVHMTCVLSAGGVIFTYDALQGLGLNDQLPSTNYTDGDDGLSPEMVERLEAIFALSFIAGITLIVTTLCKLSVVVQFNSEPHIAAIFVASTTVIWINQIPPMLGITPGTHTGLLQTPKLFIDICSHIPDANVPTVIISIVTLATILLVKEVVNVKLEHKLPAPLPIDIVVMVLAALFSSLWNWEENHSVEIVGHIPSGFPSPSVPFRSDWTDFIEGGITIGILHHLGAPTLIKHFAVKYDYEVNMDQETFALGATTTLSSILSCSGVGPSSPRVMMMESCGGKSQISYIFAAVTSLAVLLFLTDYAKNLPSCVVACILLASSIRAIANFGRLRKYWKRDKAFFLMWMVTYGSSLLLNVSDAIIVGLLFCIFVTALRSKRLHVTELYEATGRGIKYLIPSNKYNNCSPPAAHAKVIGVNNPVFFANSGALKKHILSIAAEAEKDYQDTAMSAHNGTDGGISYINQGFTQSKYDIRYSKHIINSSRPVEALKMIVLDFTGVPFIDTSTMRELLSLQTILHDKYSITLRISGLTEACRASLARAPNVYSKLSAVLYYTPRDAIVDMQDTGSEHADGIDSNQAVDGKFNDDYDEELTFM